MMVWSLFIIGLMGLFYYSKIGSIIPMVVLPTTEIIEPFFICRKRKHEKWQSYQRKIIVKPI